MLVVCIFDGNGAGGDSGKNVNKINKPNEKVIETIERTKGKERAFLEIQRACECVKAKLDTVVFQKLDFGELAVLDTFYNADVAIVDMSTPIQQASLFYHLGIRESMGMKHNIVLCYDFDPELTLSLRLSCGTGTTFFAYTIDGCNACIVSDPSLPRITGDSCANHDVPTLLKKLKSTLNDVEDFNRVHSKERFLKDLRKAITNLQGDELKEALAGMRRRLDDPQLLSVDIIVNMMISYREVQDYDNMVKLIKDLEQIPNSKISSTIAILQLYAFALNRRNQNGDRDKALEVISKAIDLSDNAVPDMICLCGRIYKDKFVESDYEDKAALENAITWYRKGFDVQPNEYAGINLATLLVISGKDFSNCQELQRIGIILNNLIGKKGSLQSLTDYWDVATFFEISVLAEDYSKASQAAYCMFKLEPPNWYLKSTVGNIVLINRFRRQIRNTAMDPLFDFWMDFFVEAIKPEAEVVGIRFPVLILEPNKQYSPSYIQINMDTEDKCVKLWHVVQDPSSNEIGEWTFESDAIKRVSMYKRDVRAVFLYVQENSDDFHIFFPSNFQKMKFNSLVCEMTSFCYIDDAVEDVVEYVYDLDEKGNRMLLGRGTYGCVYAARDKRQIKIAVKEVPEKCKQEVQPLHEEIHLHSRLKHKNIVEYRGSMSEDGYFKIFMEQVPGGSLSQLLQSKWGPLKDNETTIVHYTKQILEGLKYLHDNKIVHRDIKGDNVLVNTYSGVLKISDFGTSKRLAGINPCADTFAGTIQYMAPEVIDKGARGYGPAADIWSLGCTVIEMATGKPPFIELGSAEAAMFKIGFYKMHPEIPDSMSKAAHSFLLRCFEPSPDKRATAADLLEDRFITENYKKKKKKVQETDLHRSTSEPFDKKTAALKLNINVPRVSRLKKEGLSNSVENLLDPLEPVEEEGLYPSPTSSYLDLSAIDGGLRRSFRPRCYSDSVPSAIRLYHTENPHYSRTPSTDSALSNASGCTNLLSPDIEMTPDTGGSKDGFYLLRKDSERRMTLVQIMNQDKEKICDTWLGLLHRDASISSPKLTTNHMRILLLGLMGHVKDPSCKSISEAIDKLRDGVQFDVTALMEIQLALYVFQEAVGSSLKTHSIQPHWMFAVDNLIRNAVQAAIIIISPELGANLAGGQPDEEISTSGVSSANSNKTAAFKSNAIKELQTQLETIQSENIRLMQEFLEAQKVYQSLLQQSLTDKKFHIDQLQQIRSLQGGEIAASSNATMSRSAVKRDVPNIQINADTELVNWLKQNNFNSETICRICEEEYTLSDILELVTLVDLQRLQLRGGVLCRLWRLIMSKRHSKLKKR
ncbi:mitogen-activated protein kinase kinase kinase 15 isoform X3 [Patella vulgata]|uniref:mitogen-activated protein kinase kinase kinase 15 isoform X3 n=1 Tax=Patella vulgata TaxID=6465 RepID=UPI00217F8A5B|nr:mitogen-activated protein kinase kinase kinase 15 isoform X3 [Patella vulgata]